MDITSSERNPMDELKASGKPFRINKREVCDAWIKVKGNQGAPGVDGQSIEEFEKDLRGNLYKVWNRTRVLGVPTVADRVAQTVVAAHLETRVEPVFHPDSYGYRPGRSSNPSTR
jgi:retron-type reverse transcriptase